jgi:hypothetical protein
MVCGLLSLSLVVLRRVPAVTRTHLRTSACMDMSMRSVMSYVASYRRVSAETCIRVVEKPTTQQHCRKTYNLDSPGTKLKSSYVKPYNVDTL